MFPCVVCLVPFIRPSAWKQVCHEWDLWVLIEWYQEQRPSTSPTADGFRSRKPSWKDSVPRMLSGMQCLFSYFVYLDAKGGFMFSLKPAVNIDVT